MSQYKSNVVTYKNDTFKNLIREYSYERMVRDRVYRLEVLEIFAQREKSKKVPLGTTTTD